MRLKTFNRFNESLWSNQTNREDVETVRDILENEDLEFDMAWGPFEKDPGMIKSLFNKNGAYVFGIFIDVYDDNKSNDSFLDYFFNCRGRGNYIDVYKFNKFNPVMRRIKELTGYSLCKYKHLVDVDDHEWPSDYNIVRFILTKE